jgi:hypothetical protein
MMQDANRQKLICHCPSCGGQREHYVPGRQSRFNPSVPQGAIEEERVSERAEEIAESRRPTIFNHMHRAIGKVRENY